MRALLAVSLSLAGCSLYFQGSPHGRDGGIDSGDDDAPPDASCAEPAPAGNCVCTSTIGWACSTCPFGETTDPQACSTPGASCQIETWEHGCDCSCNDGWWWCSGETVGSTCPSGPPPDAGPPSPPDAPFPDAPPCGVLEAEDLGSPAGWDLLYGTDLSGGHGLEAVTSGATLSLTFTGTSLALDAEHGPNDGIYGVAIDGGGEVDVNGDAPDFSFVETTLATGLAQATHHAAITCRAANCSIDYFEVDCN